MEASKNVRSATLAIGLMLVLAPAARLAAVDFIRGDANSDGVVSYADSEAIAGWLFRNDELPCRDAADATDDGGVDIVDVAAVLNYVLDGAWVPPAPFPDPGPDATPDDDEPFPVDCQSYGGGSPLVDPHAAIEILDAVAVGGTDGTVYIYVAITNSVPVRGYYGRFHVAGGVLSGVDEEGVSLIPGRYFAVQSLGEDVAFIPDMNPRSAPFAPGQSVVIGQIKACMAPGTPAGEYPMVIAAGEFAHAGSNRAIHPALVGGTLHVLADVTAVEDCSEPDEPPPPLNAEYGLIGGSTPPGGTVNVGLTMKADADIQGFAYSIDFDEEVLEALGTEVVWQRPDGGEFDFAVYEMNNENATPGSGGVDEGFLIGAAVIDLREPIGMPAGTVHEVLRFPLRVRPEATATTTELRFIDGGQGTGEPVPNMVTANGNTQYTRDSASSFVFISGLIGVIPDIVTFVRGDANGDETIDISDPQRTLNHLFLGLGPPACYDAADANDDGTLNIADAIFSLAYLFSGGRPLPPPFPEVGADPTADGMGCLHAGS